jgi:hypothetical protein
MFCFVSGQLVGLTGFEAFDASEVNIGLVSTLAVDRESFDVPDVCPSRLENNVRELLRLERPA